MEWLFALTVAAGILGALYTIRLLRNRVPERRYRQQVQHLADYIGRAQQELKISPRSAATAHVPESENFLAACYNIIERGE
jgi:phosphoenolpyruvate carboxylase